MKIKNMKINDLIPYENNPRNNEGAIEYVANSIKQFGFKVPIVVDKDNVIVAGHTRWLAASALEMDEVPVVVADDLTPAQIRAFRIADNKVAEKASWDYSKLGVEIKDLMDIDLGFDLTDIGFGEFELDVLMNENNVEIDDFFESEDHTNTSSNDGMFKITIKCDEENKEKIEELLKENNIKYVIQ